MESQTFDAGVVEELVRQHQAGIYRYLLRITGNRAEAEDLSQEAWVRVLEHGAQYRGEWAFENWLRAIAHNLAVDWIRREWRWQALPADAGPQPPGIYRSRSPSPFELAHRDEVAARLRGALKRLPPRLQAVLRLRLEQGLPLGEIARRLRLTPGTVRSRLHRGAAAARAEVRKHARR